MNNSKGILASGHTSSDHFQKLDNELPLLVWKSYRPWKLAQHQYVIAITSLIDDIYYLLLYTKAEAWATPGVDKQRLFQSKSQNHPSLNWPTPLLNLDYTHSWKKKLNWGLNHNIALYLNDTTNFVLNQPHNWKKPIFQAHKKIENSISLSI